MSKKPVRRSMAINNKISNCVICEYEIKEETDNFIECDKCGKNFHSQCTKLSKKEFERLLKNEKELFVCHLCKEGGGEIRKELNTIKTELKKLEKLEKLDHLTESINFMSAKFDEVFKDVAENKKKITEMQKENKKLKAEVQTLKSSMKILNDSMVKNDCVISNLKVDDKVNAMDAVVNLSKDVGVVLEPNAFDAAYFLKTKKQSEHGKKTVVVKFSSKMYKDQLMSSKSKLKDNVNTKEVYVHDFHSKETLNLLYYAKSLKSIGFQHIYARNGRVYCKKSDLGKQQLIRCEDEVDQMLLEATTNNHYKRRSLINNREVDGVNRSDDEDDSVDGAAYVSP